MGCPAGEYLYDEVKRVLAEADGVKSVKVNLVWDPPWDMERVSPEVRYALNLY
jgi:metal-sulfur cluster biosynthetic enzyme